MSDSEVRNNGRDRYASTKCAPDAPIATNTSGSPYTRARDQRYAETRVAIGTSGSRPENGWLRWAEALGVEFRLNPDGTVVSRGWDDAAASVRDELRAHKADVLAELQVERAAAMVRRFFPAAVEISEADAAALYDDVIPSESRPSSLAPTLAPDVSLEKAGGGSGRTTLPPQGLELDFGVG